MDEIFIIPDRATEISLRVGRVMYHYDYRDDLLKKEDYQHESIC